MKFYIDNTEDDIVRITGDVSGTQYPTHGSFTMPVREGDYWRVDETKLTGSNSATVTIYELPC